MDQTWSHRSHMATLSQPKSASLTSSKSSKNMHLLRQSKWHGVTMDIPPHLACLVLQMAWCALLPHWCILVSMMQSGWIAGHQLVSCKLVTDWLIVSVSMIGWLWTGDWLVVNWLFVGWFGDYMTRVKRNKRQIIICHAFSKNKQYYSSLCIWLV